MEFGTSNRVIQKLIYSIRCYRRLCTLQYSENRINILVLDDDPDIVSILKLGLMRQGFNPVTFTDPKLALEQFGLNHKKYDLVISDIRMPTMNGFEFIKKVKR